MVGMSEFIKGKLEMKQYFLLNLFWDEEVSASNNVQLSPNIRG